MWSASFGSRRGMRLAHSCALHARPPRATAPRARTPLHTAQTLLRARRSHTLVAQFSARPLAYVTIPVVASFVGWVTNWMGVKMLFYPIEYVGLELYREPNAPYGAFGWQGVVPARTEKMAKRLVEIVSAKLLSLTEAFSHIEPGRLATLLQPAVERAICRDAPNGEWWAWLLRPLLPWCLRRVVRDLQASIEECLDLREVVLSAFMRDRRMLVELFQRVGHAELEFLVTSGAYFGFVLGVLQMYAWMVVPKPWTLPLAGALVGYATNWIAIKMLFDPAEPIHLHTPLGPFVLQGLFEKRQVEVSEEFARFLSQRVLTSPRLIDELANGNLRENFERVLRRAVPFVVPDAVVVAAANGLRDVALESMEHPTHVYVAERLGVQPTLCRRLQALSPVDFEDLLHPVFQEDEIILIVVGGVLGAAAGLVQMRFGWGGPAAVRQMAARAAHEGKGAR